MFKEPKTLGEDKFVLKSFENNIMNSSIKHEEKLNNWEKLITINTSKFKFFSFNFFWIKSVWMAAMTSIILMSTNSILFLFVYYYFFKNI